MFDDLKDKDSKINLNDISSKYNGLTVVINNTFQLDDKIDEITDNLMTTDFPLEDPFILKAQYTKTDWNDEERSVSEATITFNFSYEPMKLIVNLLKIESSKSPKGSDHYIYSIALLSVIKQKFNDFIDKRMKEERKGGALEEVDEFMMEIIPSTKEYLKSQEFWINVQKEDKSLVRFSFFPDFPQNQEEMIDSYGPDNIIGDDNDDDDDEDMDTPNWQREWEKKKGSSPSRSGNFSTVYIMDEQFVVKNYGSKEEFDHEFGVYENLKLLDNILIVEKVGVFKKGSTRNIRFENGGSRIHEYFKTITNIDLFINDFKSSLFILIFGLLKLQHSEYKLTHYDLNKNNVLISKKSKNPTVLFYIRRGSVENPTEEFYYYTKDLSVKLVDFGLSRILDENNNFKVLFGGSRKKWNPDSDFTGIINLFYDLIRNFEKTKSFKNLNFTNLSKWKTFKELTTHLFEVVLLPDFTNKNKVFIIVEKVLIHPIFDELKSEQDFRHKYSFSLDEDENN